MGNELLAFALIFTILGLAIHKFKCYWLISGYNTASKEEKQSVDIKSISKILANSLYFSSAICIISYLINLIYPLSKNFYPLIVLITVAFGILKMGFLKFMDKSESIAITILIILFSILASLI